MRCLTLASELRQAGGECLFIGRAHAGHLGDRIRASGHDLMLLPAPAGPPPAGPPDHAGWVGVDWRSDADETVAALAGRKPDWLIVDHYGLDACWHGAKIGECGALCSTNPTSGVIMVEFDRDGFTVQALADGASCTPHSVSAHMLYENSDPFILYEPGGYLDVRGARYHALGDGRVRVEGSEWVRGPYTVKLEGARVAGYQTTILAILRDAHYVAHARDWVARLTAFLQGNIARRMGLGPDSYGLEFRLIGVDGALGALENRTGQPVEVGVLGIVTAPTQAVAAEIGKLINPFVLHYPLTDDEELPTFAFPYSPATTDRGALYEFALNHVMRLDDPMQAFRLEVEILEGARHAEAV